MPGVDRKLFRILLLNTRRFLASISRAIIKCLLIENPSTELF